MSAPAPTLDDPAPDSPPDETQEDLRLHARAEDGDAEAFTSLFRRHYAGVHAFAYRLALCPGAADDIAQDTFIHAARAWGTFRREASLKSWLFAIAANLSRDHHRRQARGRARVEQLALLQTDPVAEHPGGGAADAAHEAVRRALARLAPDQREAVALVYFENLSHAEAARILGCAESTVSWRVFRARSHLKKLLRAAGDSADGAAASRHV
jgi:RNA polymerase sigma-70 factor (ECF subfamily)